MTKIWFAIGRAMPGMSIVPPAMIRKMNGIFSGLIIGSNIDQNVDSYPLALNFSPGCIARTIPVNDLSSFSEIIRLPAAGSLI